MGKNEIERVWKDFEISEGEDYLNVEKNNIAMTIRIHHLLEFISSVSQKMHRVLRFEVVDSRPKIFTLGA